MKKRNYWNNKKNCIQEAKKYNTVYELERKCYGCYLGLKRNNWLYELFPKNAKPYNFWNNKKNVINEGLKYDSKSDFKKGSGGAYNSAIKNGWMLEIEKNFHKEKKYYNFSHKIHCIYAYIFNEVKTCYIGRTINLHSRDLSHRRGRKHKNGSITYDTLFKYCNEHQIDIPTPVVLEDNLDAKQSLIREDFWLHDFKNKGWNCLNIAKTGLNSGSLGSILQYTWDYEDCKKECLKFLSRTMLKKNNYTLYIFALKKEWIDDFFPPKKNKNGTWLNAENCIKESRKYKTAKEMLKKASGAYCGASKLGILKKLEFKKE